MENPPDALLWCMALDAEYDRKGKMRKRMDFDRVFAGYDACLDMPVSLFVEELVDLDPEAKMICTVIKEYVFIMIMFSCKTLAGGVARRQKSQWWLPRSICELSNKNYIPRYTSLDYRRLSKILD